MDIDDFTFTTGAATAVRDRQGAHALLQILERADPALFGAPPLDAADVDRPAALTALSYSMVRAVLAAGGRGVLENLPPRRLQPSRKPSRNGPCPCGSGRKHKSCCGRA